MTVPTGAQFIAFSATTRLSGVEVGGRCLRKGAVDAVIKFAVKAGMPAASVPAAFTAAVDRIARSGGTPLALADGPRLLGVIHLKDTVKPDIKERFAELRRMGIRTVMVTGDNPITAATVASEAGVDDFIAEATPRPSSSISAPSRPAGGWWRCAATGPTTRRPWRRPMSASPCRPARRPPVRPATWSISTPIRRS